VTCWKNMPGWRGKRLIIPTPFPLAWELRTGMQSIRAPGSLAYPSISATIPDVCGASSVYCVRRARDEIGARLINSLRQAKPTAGDNSTNSPELDRTQKQQAVPAQPSLPPDSKGIEFTPRGEEILQVERRDTQSVGSPDDKGNLAIQGADGKLKRAVTLDAARRFGGVSRRAIDDAANKGSLKTEGKRQQRRVLVDSLLQYFLRKNKAKQREAIGSSAKRRALRNPDATTMPCFD